MNKLQKYITDLQDDIKDYENAIAEAKEQLQHIMLSDECTEYYKMKVWREVSEEVYNYREQIDTLKDGIKGLISGKLTIL